MPDTKSIVANGIVRVDLIRSTGIADGDYVTWSLSFTVTGCPPTGDPVLDNAALASEAARLLQNANRSISVRDRNEIADKIWMDKATGAVRLESDPHPGACNAVFVPNRADVTVAPGG